MPKATQQSQDWNSGSLTLESIFLIFHKLFKKARGIRVGAETHTWPRAVGAAAARPHRIALMDVARRGQIPVGGRDC